MKSPREISAMLSSRAEMVVAMLLPGGKRVNGCWQCGDISGMEGKTLQVTLAGEHVGKWRDWADPDTYRGDLLDLWAQTQSLSLKEALERASRYLGIAQPPKSLQEPTWKQGRANHNDPHQPLYEIFANRGILPETVNRFRIQWSKEKFADFQEPQNAIVFPCYSLEGERLNNSYCATVRKNGKKAVKQDSGARPTLFGWQALSEEAFGKRTVILCEGQIDCMTWTQWGFDCLSIPSGTSTKWIEAEWDNLQVFDTILLSFDMDGKTSAAQTETINRLGKHRCKIISLPFKDANDCMKEGKTAEDAKEWVNCAEPIKMAGMITAKELEDRVLKEFHPPQDGPKVVRVGLLNGENNDKSFKIRPGEVTAWTGISSHGKTAFLVSVFACMLTTENCFIASFEMKPERITRNILRSLTGMEQLTKSQIEEGMTKLGSRLVFCDKIGYIKQDLLFEMMRYSYCRYGCTQFMIDSLMRIEGLEENYPAQGEFLNRLCEFAKECNSHIHLVVHPKKIAKGERPNGNDLKGSSLLTNNADNIVAVLRNVQKERDFEDGSISKEEFSKRWDTEVTVEKDREEGLFKKFQYTFFHKINRHNLIRNR